MKRKLLTLLACVALSTACVVDNTEDCIERTMEECSAEFDGREYDLCVAVRLEECK